MNGHLHIIIFIIFITLSNAIFLYYKKGEVKCFNLHSVAFLKPKRKSKAIKIQYEFCYRCKIKKTGAIVANTQIYFAIQCNFP